MKYNVFDNQIVIISPEFFDIRDTLDCGQIFRYFYRPEKDDFIVASGNCSARVKQDETGIVIQTNEPDYFIYFFALDEDYGKYNTAVRNAGGVFEQAAVASQGIRLLRNDLTEMIISFIVSANNNIPRIKATLNKLCADYGEPIAFETYAFPAQETLASLSIEYFKSIGAGYRAEYLYNTSKLLTPDFLNSLYDLNTADARQKLCTLMGVGPKVADCILLYGLSRWDVFPTDTWIIKAYEDYFVPKPESKTPVNQSRRYIADIASRRESKKENEKEKVKSADANSVSRFFLDKLGGVSGLAQQYLFYFRRNLHKNLSAE